MQDKQPRNDKGQRHGLHEVYFSNGELMYKGHYVNNRRCGFWVRNFARSEPNPPLFYAR